MAPDNGAHKKGISYEEMKAYYTQWAKLGTYELDLYPGQYNGPNMAVEALNTYLEGDRRTVRILDAAAGTGFVGKLLVESGYRHIDALEPSAGMLGKAEQTGVFERLICDGISAAECKDIAHDSYDGLVVSGGMGENHIPTVGLHEMIRVVKPGGLVVIAMCEQFLLTVDEYRDRLEPLMTLLEAAGAWTLLSRHVRPGYWFGESGVVFAYRVQRAGPPATCPAPP